MSGFIPSSRAGFAPMPKPPSNSILRRAVAAWKAGHYQPNIDSLIDLTGRGHHARFGSAIGADTNDPVLLSFDGTPYAYFSGDSGNVIRTPDASAILLTQATIDVRIRVAHPTFKTAAGFQTLWAKYDNTTNKRTAMLRFDSSGDLEFVISSNGTDLDSLTYNAYANLPKNTPIWIRATYDSASGDMAILTSEQETPSSWTSRASKTSSIQSTLFASTEPFEIGARTSAMIERLEQGKVYRVLVFGNGAPMADFNPADSAEPHESWESSTTGETWTITRSSAANTRKIALVDRPLVLLDGVDDFLSVEHHADFDFASGDSFTVVAAIRTYRIASTLDVLSKKQSSDVSHPGFRLIIGSNGNARAQVSNGVNQSTTSDVGTPLAVGRAGTLALVGDRSTGNVRAYTNGVLNHQASFMGNVANNRTLHIGALEGSNVFNGEFIGAAIFREALTSADLALVAAELGVTP